jgi:hypothetical protein
MAPPTSAPAGALEASWTYWDETTTPYCTCTDWPLFWARRVVGVDRSANVSAKANDLDIGYLRG